ncbi:MAG: PhzF family phenazine biosynthesis protein [Deltaproteobacteria bacterium]|nr:PhzF family phenazine biosynthesis protein [Deltaproteobacteria bacterium]
MNIPLYQIDAFASQVFSGNPAAVCPLEDWLEEEVMQSIAAENNLSETAFLVSQGQAYGLRWFTPLTEIDLCGHATLASAFVVFSHLEPEAKKVDFETKSGRLTVRQEGDLLSMDFPAREPEPCPAPAKLIEALGLRPEEVLRSRDYMAVLADEEQVRSLAPKMGPLMEIDGLGVIATAPGEAVDFVSRFFAPKAGVPEDPVTGSAHSSLIPYWSRRLGKRELHALQVSPRGGELFCRDEGERVIIAGRAAPYLVGTISLPL